MESKSIKKEHDNIKKLIQYMELKKKMFHLYFLMFLKIPKNNH